MKRDHRKAEDVFPKEGGREKPLAKDDLFPDRAGDHDEVEKACFYHDGPAGSGVAITGEKEAADQGQRDEKHQELKRRENALDQRPRTCVPDFSLGGRVKWLVPLGALTIVLHESPLSWMFLKFWQLLTNVSTLIYIWVGCQIFH